MIAGPRPQTIDAARAVVRDLQAQLKLMRAELERSRKLNDGGAISKTALDEATYGAEALEARLERARTQLEELEEGTRKERVRAQRALLERLDARIESLRLDLDKSVLVAPFDGVIARRIVDEGTFAAAGSPILRILEAGGLEARIGIPVRDAPLLEEGGRFDLKVEGKSYEAEFRAVLPELDPRTRTRTAVFDLSPTTSRQLVSGQIARLRIEERTDLDGYLVPVGALVKGRRGLWAAYVSREGRIERRDVEVLHSDGAVALVRGTIEKGEELVVGGAHRVAEGQRVRAVRAD